MHIKFKKLLSAGMAVLLSAGLAGCGNTTTQGGGGETQAPESGEEDYVWVASFRDFPESGQGNGEESGEYIGNVQLMDGKCYFYVSSYGEVRKNELRCLDLTDESSEPTTLYSFSEASLEEGKLTDVDRLTPAPDGGVVMIKLTYPVVEDTDDPAAWERQQSQRAYYLYKVAADGTDVFETDITEYLRMDAENSYISTLLVNKEGQIFVSNGRSYIWVFDGDGTHVADISLTDFGGWIQGMGFTADGSLAIIGNGAQGDTQVCVYDEEKKAFGEPLQNLPPNIYNSGLSAAGENSLLLEGEGILYLYDMETQTYGELLRWLDSDVNPDYIDYVTMLDENTVLAYYRDWDDTEEKFLVTLTKTPVSQTVQKQTITLGCMGIPQAIQSAVVKFNRQNDTYRVEICDYSADVNWSQDGSGESYADAQTRMNSDIITGNAPDMFLESSVNISLFAAKGLIEDLNPYLDASSVVSRDDLFETVLDAYSENGILCTIPRNFSISTYVGRASELGSDAGWTVEEMAAYAEEYPDAQLFAYATNRSILQFCLVFDFDSYVNWETGECFFDTDNFKRVLELAAKYPQDVEYDVSEPTLVGSHQALLYQLNLQRTEEWQLARLIFGEPINPIGFPSANGTGVVAQGDNGICISSTSENKDACWAFIESLLTKDSFGDRYSWGLPIRKDVYEEQLQEDMTPDYETDENGDQVLDENGEPIEISTSSYGWEDITFDLYAVTQEEADEVMDLIERIDGRSVYDENIMTIVEEETGAYFAGQKNVDEVADIIQSRVKTYVSENM